MVRVTGVFQYRDHQRVSKLAAENINIFISDSDESYADVDDIDAEYDAKQYVTFTL